MLDPSWLWARLHHYRRCGADRRPRIDARAAMNDRSSVVVYAYIKPDPVQVALFGLVFLGAVVTPGMAAAILTATAGVIIMAIKPGTPSSLTATLLGLAAGAMFALSAVAFRGAILRLEGESYVMAATVTVVVGLVLQSC